MQLFRIGSLVPFHGQVVRVVNRYVFPDGALYILHTKDRNGQLQQHQQVTFGQIVSAMCEHASHCVGDKVEVARFDRYVKARWWSCARGTVIYRINSFLDEGHSWIVPQEDLLTRLGKEQVSM